MHRVAIVAPSPDTVVAAMQIHGVYSSMVDARQAIAHLVKEHTDLRHFVLHDCDSFLPVVNPDAPDCPYIGDTEEMSAPENTNEKDGRMGSVCDLRPRTNQPSEGVPNERPATHVRSTPAEQKKEIRTQKAQLDDLLGSSLPPDPETTDATQYAMVRGRYATLRAFERRLERLVAEAKSKVDAAAETLVRLDESHPQYAGEYKAHYLKALGESGIPPDSVPFMRYLNEG